ncbi:hypothetical protein ABVT39_024784 [Epinephelus coioides]
MAVGCLATPVAHFGKTALSQDLSVKVMFPSNSTSVQPPPGALEGITFGNSTEEVQTSACAISDYLNKHLPAIIKSLTENYEDILKNTTTFLDGFNTVVKQSSDQNEPKQCHRNVTAADDYNKKRIGFQIIHLTRRWVEIFTGTNTTCQHDENNA